MKVQIIFWGIIFFTINSCKTQHELSSANKFKGMWKLDRFETFDTLTNKWRIDTTRLGYEGFILYDGLGHMGVQQTPPGYKDYDVNKNIDSLNNNELKKLLRFYRSNYVYFSNYEIDKNTIEHKRLSATNPNDWGTVLKRDFEFIGDTLILTTHENINGSKLRIRWIKLNPY